MIDMKFSDLVENGVSVELAESDAKFRARILMTNIQNLDVVHAVEIATGRALDILGREHGLKRETGPVIDLAPTPKA